MSEASGQSPTAATQNPAAAWRVFAASPAAPSGALSALELDGYLTGVIVAPSPIQPPQWMIGLIGYDKALIDDDERLATAFRAVAVMFKAIETRIGQSLRRLEAERGG